MARSLVIKHEEKPSTSPLLTAFLLLAFAWLAASAIAAASSDGGASGELSVPAIDAP